MGQQTSIKTNGCYSKKQNKKNKLDKEINKTKLYVVVFSVHMYFII